MEFSNHCDKMEVMSGSGANCLTMVGTDFPCQVKLELNLPGVEYET